MSKEIKEKAELLEKEPIETKDDGKKDNAPCPFRFQQLAG